MTTTIAIDELHRFCTSIFEHCGIAADDARRAADVVCYADEHGFTTHGSFNLVNIYVPRLLDGRISARAGSRIVTEAASSALVDGGRGLGLLVGTEAMDLAIAKAAAGGIGAVAVHNSTHFGSAGFYTSRAAAQGVIGLAVSNCGAQGVVPPLGGRRRMFGTNPLSFAAPAGERPPFVLDMSTTIVSTGKLRAAVNAGQPVPTEWLQRPDGTHTSDPSEYYDGTAEVTWLGSNLAGGSAKGFGLGLLVEMLAGVLPGAAVGPNPSSLTSEAGQGDSDIGHFFLAIDPAAFQGRKQFSDASEQMLDVVTACPPTQSASRVLYAGIPEAEHAARAAERGILLPPHVIAALTKLGEECSVEFPSAALAAVGEQS